MSDSTKTLLGGLIAGSTLLGIFVVMADCSKSVSRTGADVVEACVRSGGQWIGSNDGSAAGLDFCSMPEKRK